MNGILFGIVEYWAADMHVVVCPYIPRPFRVVKDAAFSLMSSMSRSMAMYSGLSGMESIWCSCFGNPFIMSATVGAIFVMLYCADDLVATCRYVVYRG